MKNLSRSIVALALLGAGASQAATMTVTAVGNAPALDSWYLTNFRGLSTGHTSNTVAAISGANPRSGNGSVQMSLTNDSGKADYAYTWGFKADRTLGSLNSLGYDWFRAGGDSAAHLQPAMRLLYDADGDASSTGDQGYLVWEQIYQGAPTLQGQWVSSDILGGNFWQRQFSPGNTVEDFDMTLAQWTAGMAPGVATFDRLSGATAILGIEFGIGSGWGGTFDGFVDNVRVGFAGADATTFNFELERNDVPEPASLALLALGAFGIAAARRRKQ